MARGAPGSYLHAMSIGRIAARVGVLSVLVAGSACIEGAKDAVTGPALCTQPVGDAASSGCALLYGVVLGPSGQGLDGISGSVRPGAQCDCSAPVVSVDDAGRFSVTVRRFARAGAPPTSDTGSATLVMFASAPKYPRHSTGGFYFDTARVVLRFVPIGSPPVPLEVNLRIPLP